MYISETRCDNLLITRSFRFDHRLVAIDIGAIYTRLHLGIHLQLLSSFYSIERMGEQRDGFAQSSIISSII